MHSADDTQKEITLLNVASKSIVRSAISICMFLLVHCAQCVLLRHTCTHSHARTHTHTHTHTPYCACTYVCFIIIHSDALIRDFVDYPINSYYNSNNDHAISITDPVFKFYSFSTRFMQYSNTFSQLSQLLC